jgi:hypothetical protein
MQVAVLAISIWSGIVSARPAGTVGEDFIHVVGPGETLISLAKTYLLDGEQWRVLQLENNVADPYKLVIGSEMRIPLRLIPVTPDQARVVYASSDIKVNGSKYVKTTDVAPVTEGDMFETGEKGWVTIELGDGSRISVASNSRVEFERLKRFRGPGLIDSIIRIEHGNMEQTVSPQGGGVGRFEIRARKASTGVRGTRYRVRVVNDRMQSEVLEGVVDVRSHKAMIPVQAGYGVLIGSDGHLSEPRPLLPAPSIAITPPQKHGALEGQLAPIDGAIRYRIDIGSDAAFVRRVQTLDTDTPAFRFMDLPVGEYYVRARAIGMDGMEGRETTRPVKVEDYKARDWEEHLPPPHSFTFP